MSVGVGYDSHRFDETRPLVLGGVEIPGSPGLAAHSDGDAIAHAVTDAVIGATAMGDIGTLFPDDDPANAGADSVEMLTAVVRSIEAQGLGVQNVDVTVITEKPHIGSHASAMRERIAEALGTSFSSVSIKAKSNEGMGWIGRGEGLAVIAVALVEPFDKKSGRNLADND